MVPEEENAQLRGYYALESNWGALEAQVLRGTDAQIVIVDPELNEREESRTPGPGAVATLGEGYGTHDDPGEELEGLTLYTYQDDDPAGTWRGIFMASDNGGVHSPKWRTHTPVRMLTANQAKPPCSANYSSDAINGHADMRSRARSSQALAGIDPAHDQFGDVEDDMEDPNALQVRTALRKADIVFIGPCHGTDYRRGFEGDAVETSALPWPQRNGLLCGSKSMLQWYWSNHGEYITYAVYGPGDDPKDDVPSQYYGLARRSYTACDFVFVSACYSNKSTNSICQVLKTYGGVHNVLGYTRSMDYHLGNGYIKRFWEAFSTDGLTSKLEQGTKTIDLEYHYRYRSLWTRGIRPNALKSCAKDALDNWWRVMDVNVAVPVGGDVWKGYFLDSDIAYPNQAAPSEASTFVRFNNDVLH